MKYKGYSILRNLQYSELSKGNFTGKVLDIGGSKKSGYHSYFKNSVIDTVNIDESYDCDLVFDIQKKFPIGDSVYDIVTSINVFEHIFDFSNCFSETARVLKPAGLFIISVPFMHQIHGSPDDFFRYTESSLREILRRNNFVVEDFKSLGFGLFTLNFQIIAGTLPKIIRVPCMYLAICLDNILNLLSKKYRVMSSRIPLGYFVVAHKR